VTPAAFGVGCDLQHHSAAHTTVGTQCVHGVPGGLGSHAYVPFLSAQKDLRKSCDKDVSGPGIQCFRRFTAFSQRTERSGEVARKTTVAPGHRESTLTRRVQIQVTRADAWNTFCNQGSNETDGTFTVFAKLTVCVVSWSRSC
jgi:hypothetical protein